jgi:hypothetical protein
MKIALLLLLAGLTLCSASAQQLQPTMTFITKNKPAYLLTSDGTRVTGTLEKFVMRKKHFEAVELRTEAGQVVRYAAQDLRELGLPPAKGAKVVGGILGTASVAKARNTDLNGLEAEYIKFYPEYLADQQRHVLLQLLNPDFSSKVRIYGDSFANQTKGVGIGGVKLTGGVDKTYYVRVKDQTLRLSKSGYGRRFREYFADCPQLAQQYRSPAWRDFPRHVHFYDQQCQ